MFDYHVCFQTPICHHHMISLPSCRHMRKLKGSKRYMTIWWGKVTRSCTCVYSSKGSVNTVIFRITNPSLSVIKFRQMLKQIANSFNFPFSAKCFLFPLVCIFSMFSFTMFLEVSPVAFETALVLLFLGFLFLRHEVQEAVFSLKNLSKELCIWSHTCLIISKQARWQAW